MLGEIRDGETAGMALKAAMTGHQVYRTLHTNDSFGAIPRLFDLGLKPGMVAGAIVSIFAQRLTRRLCGACKEEYTPDHVDKHIHGKQIRKFGHFDFRVPVSGHTRSHIEVIPIHRFLDVTQDLQLGSHVGEFFLKI